MGGQNLEKVIFLQKVMWSFPLSFRQILTYRTLCTHVRCVQRYTPIKYYQLRKCIQGPLYQGGVGKKMPKFDFELKLRRNGSRSQVMLET